MLMSTIPCKHFECYCKDTCESSDANCIKDSTYCGCDVCVHQILLGDKVSCDINICEV